MVSENQNRVYKTVKDPSDNPQNGESRGRSKPADFSSSDSETEEYVDTRFMW